MPGKPAGHPGDHVRDRCTSGRFTQQLYFLSGHFGAGGFCADHFGGGYFGAGGFGGGYFCGCHFCARSAGSYGY